jgi:type I restriction enzyme S subunit
MYGATVGKLGMLGIPAATNQAICGIRCGAKIEPWYLFYFLLHIRKSLIEMSIGGAQPNISQNIVRRIRVPLPSLDEQRRIVDILNHASSIRRLREQAQAKAREIIPALFLDMFGDPATNPKGWERRTLGEIGELDRGKSKHRPRNAPELFGGKYPFIQTGDVANSGGIITTYTQTYSENGLAQSKMWSAGTLCITIAANIAMTGILTSEACFPDSVVGFTPGKQVTVEYVHCALDLLQPQIEKAAPQLAQKNINLKILRALPFPIPPLADQRRFSGLVADIRGSLVLAARANEMSEILGTALLHQAFVT